MADKDGIPTEGRKVTVQETPSLIKKAEVKLIQSDFEAFIHQKGYDVYHDKMMKCPCIEAKNAVFIDCENCNGSGWVIIERVETRMVLQSMNKDTKWKQWSEEKLGTVLITASEKEILGHMDRIISRRGFTISSEILEFRKFKGKPFAFTVYDIIEPLKLFKFAGSKNKLLPLIEGTDYDFEDNRILFNNKFLSANNRKFSIRYKHRPQFHIIDLIRDVMYSDIDDENKLRINERFPVSAVGRRSHYVLDRLNFNEDNLQDNTQPT